MSVLWLGSGQVKFSDFSKILDFSGVAKLSSRYVFDSKETHEHVFDLDNSARFLEKNFLGSDPEPTFIESIYLHLFGCRLQPHYENVKISPCIIFTPWEFIGDVFSVDQNDLFI